MIKFMWNGIKVDGTLYKGHYLCGGYTTQSGLPQDAITIYARDYMSFPRIEGLQIRNGSDIMTDYFETDTIRVLKDNKFYNEILNAYLKQEEHNKTRHDKRMGVN